MGYTPNELMVAVASRELRDGERVLVGVGIPNLACNLALRLHAPGLVLIYESGAIGARPARMPLSIGDPCLVTGAKSVCTMFEQFAYYLQGGRIDVGFLGGAQVDRWGTINSTVIGDYNKPRVRLPGSGGACDTAANAGRILIMTTHDRRKLVDRVDFVTSPGLPGGDGGRGRLGYPGRGPEAIITDLGVLRYDNTTGEMVLTDLHPGVTVEGVKERTGWLLKVASKVKTAQGPSERELSIMRSLDPRRVYLR